MYIALDVGGSSIKAGLVVESTDDTPGRRELVGVGDVHREPLDHTADVASIVGAFVRAISSTHASIATELGDTAEQIERIAIAVPDPFDHSTGTSFMQHKFAAVQAIRLGDEILRSLAEAEHPAATVPIGWCNDAAAAVAGEAVAGAGRGYARVFGITLGTGLGAAFIVHGQLVEHVGGYTIPETYLLRAPDGRMADDALSARAYVERAVHGGTPAEFGADLATFLAPIVAALDADLVVVGGGGLASFEQFAPAAQAKLVVPLMPALLDRWAPLIGAVTLTQRSVVETLDQRQSPFVGKHTIEFGERFDN